MIYDLKAGWNMISLPCEVEETDLEGIFPLLPPAYTYNAETMGYEALEGLPEPNQGLFMLCMADTTIIIECPEATVDTIPEDNSFCIGLKLGSPMGSMKVSPTPEDGLLVSGRAIIGIDPAPKLFMASMTPELDIDWIKTIDFIEGTEISTSGDHFFIAGKTSPLSPEVFISKMDMTGDEIWTTVLLEPSYHEPVASCPTSDGGFVLLTEMAIIKLDGDGGFDFSLNIDMDGENIYENIAGNLIVTGDLTFGLEPPALTVIEINPSGELVSFNAIDGFPDYQYSASCVLEDGLVTTGMAIEDSTIVITRLNSEMIPVWSRKTDITGQVECVKEIDTDTYVISGRRGDDALSVIVDGDGVISAHLYDIDFIGMGDVEFFTDVYPWQDGLLFAGSKYNYGVEEQTLIVFSDHIGSSCCASMITGGFESLTTSNYDVDISLSEIVPSVRDTSFVINTAEGMLINPLCPR